MKQILFFIFTSFFFSAMAQVPPLREETVNGNNDILAPDVSETKKTIYYQQNGKFGFARGNKKQEAIYDNITSATNRGFIVKKDNLYGITNMEGEVIGKIKYDSIGFNRYRTGSEYIVKHNGNYGTMSEDGKILLPIKYHKVIGGNKAISFIENKNAEVQLIFNKKDKAYKGKIEYVELFGNLAIVKSGGKYGVVKNEVIIPFEYDDIFYKVNRNPSASRNGGNNSPYVSEYPNVVQKVENLIVQKNGKLGLMDSNGAVIYPIEHDEILKDESNGLYRIKKGNLFGLYFADRKAKTEIELERTYVDGREYVLAVKNGKAGAYNMRGEIVVPFIYDIGSIARMSGVGFRVSKDGKKGIIDPEGKEIIPIIYDNVSPTYGSGSNEFLKVESNGRMGIVNLNGEVVIPVEYEGVSEEKGVFKVLTPSPNRKLGMFDRNGNAIVPPEYEGIYRSVTENSKITILKKDDNSFNFLNENDQLIFSEDLIEYGFVLDENRLLNPFSLTENHLLFVTNKKGNIGMLNEMSGNLDIPMVYDEILQRFESRKHTYYSVRKGKKFGLINEKNEEIIPIKYKSINLDLIALDPNDDREGSYQVVVKKGKKFGTVNLKNEIQIPFKYDHLQRISEKGIYKAKKGKQYQVINSKNEVLNTAEFDEVANYEQIGGQYVAPSNRALTFNNGMMRAIDETGKFTSAEIPMQPHNGYRTFDELKFALVEALDSQDNALIKDFVDKIAPSKHVLYYLERNIFDNKPLRNINIKLIKEKYHNDLMNFKKNDWNDNPEHGYSRSSLLEVQDFTLYRDGMVTNHRIADHAFGDTQFMEKLLRNAVKVNGFWISSYFMKHSFRTY